MILSLNLTCGWLNEFFHKTWPPEELLNHKQVNYFSMPNFHDVMKNPWWICWKDVSVGQKWFQKSKLHLKAKCLFRTIPNTLSDKTILQNYFLNCFSYNIWEKKFLRVKTFVLRKRLKNKQVLIPVYHLVIRLLLGTFWTRLFTKKIISDAKYIFYMKMQPS